jgi:hypothetical protein
MTKRRAAGAGVAVGPVLGLLAACILVLRSVPPDTVTREACHRVAVETVFGRAADRTESPAPPVVSTSAIRRGN